MLRPLIDSFFDDVVVLTEEPEIRTNRLALLKRVIDDFGGIADFSEIVVAG
jgi:glycyl-tRNA synthetase beta chain